MLVDILISHILIFDTSNANDFDLVLRDHINSLKIKFFLYRMCSKCSLHSTIIFIIIKCQTDRQNYANLATAAKQVIKHRMWMAHMIKCWQKILSLTPCKTVFLTFGETSRP